MGCVQLKMRVVFITNTGGGSGQLLTILWFLNRGPANYLLICDFSTGIGPTTNYFSDLFV